MDWRWNFPLYQVREVDFFEPGMIEDFLDSTVDSESVDGVLDEQVLEEAFEFLGELDIRGEVEFFAENRLVDLVRIVRVERWEPGDEFVEEGAETVVVHRVGMSKL